MKALIRSHRFRRVHLAMVGVLVVILVSVMLSYFASLATRLEALRVEQMLIKLEQHLLLHHQLQLSLHKTSSCQALLAQLKAGAVWHEGLGLLKLSPKNQWQFEPDALRMVYHVHNTDYFDSPVGNVIEITLLCQNGSLLFKTTPYQWCQVFGLWGCRAW